MKKRLIALVLTVVLIASLAWAGLGYFTFVSQTVTKKVPLT